MREGYSMRKMKTTKRKMRPLEEWGYKRKVVKIDDVLENEIYTCASTIISISNNMTWIDYSDNPSRPSIPLGELKAIYETAKMVRKDFLERKKKKEKKIKEKLYARNKI